MCDGVECTVRSGTGPARCGARVCPMDCCMMMETLVEDEWGYGDYFRAIDGYVAMEQTRLMASALHDQAHRRFHASAVFIFVPGMHSFCSSFRISNLPTSTG